MVKVYFEQNGYAELVAVFNNEETYIACLPALEARAKEQGMIVTESVEENELDIMEVNNRPTFFLFGSEACQGFEQAGDEINGAIGLMGEVFKLNPQENSLAELLDAYDGWEDYVEISENDFNKYKEAENARKH